MLTHTEGWVGMEGPCPGLPSGRFSQEPGGRLDWEPVGRLGWEPGGRLYWEPGGSPVNVR